MPTGNYYLDKAGLEFTANVFGFSSEPESIAMAKIAFS